MIVITTTIFVTTTIFFLATGVIVLVILIIATAVTRCCRSVIIIGTGIRIGLPIGFFISTRISISHHHIFLLFPTVKLPYSIELKLTRFRIAILFTSLLSLSLSVALSLMMLTSYFVAPANYLYKQIIDSVVRVQYYILLNNNNKY